MIEKAAPANTAAMTRAELLTEAFELMLKMTPEDLADTVREAMKR